MTELTMDTYPDDQIRQELVGFFRWPPSRVAKLGPGELWAWKKHALNLRAVGFWWFRT